jgi:YggT family protein
MAILAGIVSWVIFIYQFLILVRVLLSWFNTDPRRAPINHPLVLLLNRVTDPILKPLRRYIPPVGGTFDISPVVALLILEVVRQIIVRILSWL